MNELAVVVKGADWSRLKALVLDSVSSPITKRVYNLGLDEFFAWYAQEPRPGFTKATVAAWRVALEARGLGAVSINVRITAVRNWRSRPPITACWRPSWPTASRA
jgi:site-specific recombinase XerC